MKLSGEQIDDRVVEVHWDPEHNRWRLMRFRDDKPNGNFRTVVDNIIQSIVDGVEKPMVCHLPVYIPLLTCSTSVARPWPSHSKRVESSYWPAAAKHSGPSARCSVGAQWPRRTTSATSCPTSIWTYRSLTVEQSIWPCDFCRDEEIGMPPPLVHTHHLIKYACQDLQCSSVPTTRPPLAISPGLNLWWIPKFDVLWVSDLSFDGLCSALQKSVLKRLAGHI